MSTRARWVLLWASGLVLAALVALIAVASHPLTWTGADNPSGVAYGLWSGFLSVAVPPLLTLAGIALLAWWHHQCHSPWCFRWGRFEVTEQGHTFRKCRYHHPLDNPGA